MRNDRGRRKAVSIGLLALALSGTAFFMNWDTRAQTQPVDLSELVVWFRAMQEQILPIAPPMERS